MKISFLLLLASFSWGCSTTYTYKGKSYSDPKEFLAATKTDMDEIEVRIQPLQEPLTPSCTVLLPTDNIIKMHGVRLSGPAQPELANTLGEHLKIIFTLNVNAISKRNVCKIVKQATDNNPDSITISDDYLIYLYMPGLDKAQWYVKPKDGQKKPILYDTTIKGGQDSINAWLGSIETIMKNNK
jgi:hypothetical protein